MGVGSERLRTDLVKARRQPRRVLPALVRAVRPGSSFGADWTRLGEHITFSERGFVAAPSPSRLLARHNYEERYVRELLGGRQIGESLELGCGFGRMSYVVSQLVGRHVAVDVNADALGLARASYPGVTFLQASATDLPFEDDSFDLVFTWTVLQHVPPAGIEAALAEIRRVLRPDGVALLCEAARNPDTRSHHVWDRPSSFYAERLAPAQVRYESYVVELDEVDDAGSPGLVMLLEP